MVKSHQNRIELVTRPSFEGGSTFKQQLMEKYQAVHADHDQLLSSHANKCRSLLIFATDLYLQMKENNPSDADSGTVYGHYCTFEPQFSKLAKFVLS